MLYPKGRVDSWNDNDTRAQNVLFTPNVAEWAGAVVLLDLEVVFTGHRVFSIYWQIQYEHRQLLSVSRISPNFRFRDA